MKPKAVIFDLFGTLTGHFSVAKHELFMSQMSEILAVPFEQFRRHWIETFRQRLTGSFKKTEENIEYICKRLKQECSRVSLDRATKLHYDFTKEAMQPRDDAIETLSHIKDQNIRLGLVSNCAPGVQHVWKVSPFHSYIKAPVFSFDVGIMKPDPRIYRIATTNLGVEPSSCFYIGDGSGNELKGACAVGMTTILLKIPLNDVYDPIREDVANWKGTAISTLAQLKQLV